MIKKGIAAFAVCTLALAGTAEARTIKWSGQNWHVRHTTAPASPGWMVWSNSTASARVSRGDLRLKIVNGQAVETCGPLLHRGTFTWRLRSNGINNVDPWRVTAFYFYGTKGQEFDLEYASWGSKTAKPGQFVSWKNKRSRTFVSFWSREPRSVSFKVTTRSVRVTVLDASGHRILDRYSPLRPRGNGFQPCMSRWLWAGDSYTPRTPQYLLGYHPILRVQSFQYRRGH